MTVLWFVFGFFVLFSLFFDTGLVNFSKYAKSFTQGTSVGSAFILSLFWILVAVIFGFSLYYQFGSKTAMEYFSCYLLEKGLSIDNVFVFHVIFRHFAVPLRLEKRVLQWGILGALIMRAIFIALGIQLLKTFQFLIFILGGFLITMGLSLFKETLNNKSPAPKIKSDDLGIQNPHSEKDYSNHYVLSFIKKRLPYADGFFDGQFIIRGPPKEKSFLPTSLNEEGDLDFKTEGQMVKGLIPGRFYATKLLITLICIELMDAVFALDSIPAILSLTDDPLVMYTSNIFAILGLRALFFAISGMINKFTYLQYGLGILLIFVGLKMLLSKVYKVPLGLSLVVIILVIGLSIFASWVLMRKDKEEEEADV